MMIMTHRDPQAPGDQTAHKSTVLHRTQTSVRFFDCLTLAPEPWANGGGTTRTIARGIDETANAVWRVSLAELSSAARFSQFTGFDRTLLMMDDGAVDLHLQDGQLIARTGQPVHFSGDLHVRVGLPASPVNVLNVMTRRDSHQASVSVAVNSTRITPAATQILLCLSGIWSLESALLHETLLKPLSGIWLDGRQESLDVRPHGPNAQLVSIAIVPRQA